ncbi:Zinc transporter 6, chloroplastic, partial [Linum grandiflorum]
LTFTVYQQNSSRLPHHSKNTKNHISQNPNKLPQTMSVACQLDSAASDRTLAACRDTSAATHLKLASILAIFLTSAIGISSPVILARLFRGKPLYDKAVLLIKCFAAGVILSTSLVHVLPDAYAALADCRVASVHPWKDFPFAGGVTLVGCLLALLVEITAGEHVGHHGGDGGGGGGEYEAVFTLEEEGEQEDGEADPARVKSELDYNKVKMKQRLVSQVLEIGIIFHSVIIGVTMGTSQNRCTIKPLVTALCFHQIFEGMGLGGCIAQAGFGMWTVAYMSIMFAVTTPLGILLGMAIFWLTGYDDSNPNALIMEGLLGSLSSGILIYMALVDLIALDFFQNKLMSSAPGLKKVSFIALLLGSTSMSILALWA